MGDFSTELCGGTHVSSTGKIRQFKILSENGVAAGVRRIEALTGDNVTAYYEKLEQEMNEAAALVKASPETLADHIRRLQEELKSAKAETEALKAKAAQAAVGDVTAEAEDIDGVKVLVKKLDDVDMNDMRTLGDELKGKLGESLIVLASAKNGKVSLMATATDGAVKKGAHAGNLIRTAAKLVGGGGGGRPNMAQAGGKEVSKLDDALAAAKAEAEKQLAK
jgi:alanyl-tRNA synthetase